MVSSCISRPQHAEKLWHAAVEAAREFDCEPIGLGARDSLRLEMKYALYGNDIDATTNPLDAGLGWVVKLEKGEFVGQRCDYEGQRGRNQAQKRGFRAEREGFPSSALPDSHRWQEGRRGDIGDLFSNAGEGDRNRICSAEYSKIGDGNRDRYTGVR